MDFVRVRSELDEVGVDDEDEKTESDASNDDMLTTDPLADPSLNDGSL